MDLFSGADGSGRNGHLTHATVCSSANSDTRRSDVGEHEWLQLGELAEKGINYYMGRLSSFLQRLLLRDGVKMTSGGVASQISSVEIAQFDWCSDWSLLAI